MTQRLLLSFFIFSLLTVTTVQGKDFLPWDDGVQGTSIEFSVYPNPSNGVFRLNIEEDGDTPYQVQIVDLIGKEMLNQTVKAQEETTFDLSNAPKGVYFIKITQGREQIIKRVVIR